MKNVLRLLNKQQALELLPFGRRGLDNLIKKGEIGFKKVSGRYYFLESDIKRWANDLEYRTNSTSVEITTTHISLCKPQTEKAPALEYLLAQRILDKQKISAYKKSQNFKPKNNANEVNCLA